MSESLLSSSPTKNDFGVIIDNMNNIYHISVDAILYFKYSNIVILSILFYFFLKKFMSIQKQIYDYKQLQKSKGKLTYNYNPSSFWNFLTNWSLMLYLVYEIFSTLMLKMDINTSYYQILLKICNYGHYLNQLTQTFITIFWFALISKKVPVFLPNQSKLLYFFADFLHLYPCLILATENIILKYELQQKDIIIPIGYFAIYLAFNIYQFFVYNIQPYEEILDYRKLITWIIIVFLQIIFCGFSYVLVILRQCINSKWI